MLAQVCNEAPDHGGRVYFEQHCCGCDGGIGDRVRGICGCCCAAGICISCIGVAKAIGIDPVEIACVVAVAGGTAGATVGTTG